MITVNMRAPQCCNEKFRVDSLSEIQEIQEDYMFHISKDIANHFANW